jgi:hypothetical protein
MEDDKAKKGGCARRKQTQEESVKSVSSIKTSTTTAWYPKEAAVLGVYPQHAMHA